MFNNVDDEVVPPEGFNEEEAVAPGIDDGAPPAIIAAPIPPVPVVAALLPPVPVVAHPRRSHMTGFTLPRLLKLLGVVGAGLFVFDRFFHSKSICDAARDGNALAIPILNAAGADVNALCHDGLTSAYIAAYNGHPKTIIALKDAGANMDTPTNGFTPFYAAASQGNAEAIRALKTTGANVNTPTNGFTPLHIAAYKGHLDAATALLEAEADVNVKIPGLFGLTMFSFGWTALDIARENASKGEGAGHSGVVELLETHLKKYPNGIKQ